VLDGSWSLARRMFLHIEELRGLPILSLPPPKIAPQRLRKPPREDGMSTLEAISAAVKLLEGEEVARPLDELFEQMVERVLAVRGRRHG
jgi:DTW domain-containing protein YfiP